MKQLWSTIQWPLRNWWLGCNNIWVYAATTSILPRRLLKGGGLASVGDVVLLTNGNTWTAGKILLHFGIASETWTLVASFNLLVYVSKTGTAKWQETDTWNCVPVLDILTAVAYTNSKEGPLTLIPFHLR